uniref:FBD domain-containing protein n=1 Tax=Ditylenchus dipsaci TaxID=166011 RepID=A0A915D193_9BILA
MTTRWKRALLSISPLWNTSKCLVEVDTKGQESVAALQELLNFSTILSFNLLILKLIRVQRFVPVHFHLYPALYNCNIIQFVGFENYTEEVNLLAFLENVPKERQNKLKVQLKCLTAWNNMTELLSTVKQRFADAEAPCSYNLEIFHIKDVKLDSKNSFKMTNGRTREILHYYIDKSPRIHAVLKRWPM